MLYPCGHANDLLARWNVPYNASSRSHYHIVPQSHHGNNRGACPQKAAVAHRYVSGQRATGRNVNRVTNFAIVVDVGSRIDDREIADASIGVENCTAHDCDTSTHAS